MRNGSPVEPIIPVVKREEIPSHWDLVPIGDICASVNKVNPKDNPTDGFKYIDISGIDNERFMVAETKAYYGNNAPSRARQLVCEGDIVFSTVRTYLKNMARITRELDGEIASTGFCVLRPREPEYSGYLYYYLQYEPFLNELAKFQRGTSYPAVRDGDIFAQLIPVPPKSEAVRIIAEIEKQFSRLDEAVANLKRVKANLKRYKAAVLKAVVEGTLISEQADDWEETVIGDITELVTKGSSPNWQGFDYIEKGIVFVRSQNVGWGSLDLTETAHLSPLFNHREKKSVLKTDDVLLNIVGASIGRAALASQEVEGGNVNQAVAVIRPLRTHLLPKFLMYYLLSDKAQKLIHSQKVDVARANYSLDQIKKMSLRLPSMETQQHIVAEVESRLSVIEAMDSVSTINLSRAEHLSQAILKKAFVGSLA